MSEENPTVVPSGFEYLALYANTENACQQFTSDNLDSLGVRVPKCIEALGTVLLYGERVACCFWNCPGGDYTNHVVQYVLGRANSFGRASIRLALMGYYDESLSLVRSLGEIANLFLLFDLDASELADWKASNAETRHKRFRPAQIRRRIEAKGSTVPMSEKKYGLLCELATHPVPQLRPQSFNIHGRPSAGGVYQEAGFVVALNETAAMESLIVLLAAKLCDIPKEHRVEIKKHCLECVSQAGISVENLPEIWEKMKAEASRESDC